MNNNVLFAIIAAIVIIGAGVWVFRGNDAIPPEDEAALSSGTVDLGDESGMPVVPPEGRVMEDGVIVEGEITGGVTTPEEKAAIKEFTVTGKSFSFSPATMTVKKGDRVKVTFKNSGGVHDWRLDEFGAATRQLQSGAQETIEFVADKAGSFEYYCSVGNHRAMGMKGTLVVQ